MFLYILSKKQELLLQNIHIHIYPLLKKNQYTIYISNTEINITLYTCIQYLLYYMNYTWH